MKLLNLAEVQRRLDLGPSMVRRLASTGELKATKVGRDWLVAEVDLARFMRKPRRGPGRPPTKT